MRVDETRQEDGVAKVDVLARRGVSPRDPRRRCGCRRPTPWRRPAGDGHRHHPARVVVDHGCGRPAVSARRTLRARRDVILDVRRRRAGRRIVPRRVAIGLAVHDHVVVARDSFPRTGRMRRARSYELPAYGVRGEICIALHRLDAIALRDDRALPQRSCHSDTPERRKRMRYRAPLAAGGRGSLRPPVAGYATHVATGHTDPRHARPRRAPCRAATRCRRRRPPNGRRIRATYAHRRRARGARTARAGGTDSRSRTRSPRARARPPPEPRAARSTAPRAACAAAAWASSVGCARMSTGISAANRSSVGHVHVHVGVRRQTRRQVAVEHVEQRPIGAARSRAAIRSGE